MPYFSEALNESTAESDTPGSSFSPEMQSALLALETGDFYARWEAAKQISASGAAAADSLPAVIRFLLALLQEDDSEELSWYVARILGTLNHPLAVEGLVHLLQTDPSPDVVGMAATALASCGAAAIPPLVTLLHQQETRLVAIRALAQIHHPDVISPLLSLTADPAPTIRATAIDALSRFAAPQITSIFFAALHDPDSTVRRSAVSALGVQAQSLNSEAADSSDFVAALQPLLWDVNLDVCCQTALTLGRIGSSAAVAQLNQVLRSPYTPAALQQTIIRSLGWIETPTAIAALHQGLECITVLEQESQLEIITVLGRLRATASVQLAVQILLDLLRFHHPICQSNKGKQTIAHSLGQLAASTKQLPRDHSTPAHPEINQIQSSAMTDALIEMLNDSDTVVRFHAIAALKAFDDRSVNLKLMSLMQDETISANLREEVAIALAERKRSIE